MGEIANMILDGILDEQTGEYIGEAVGYPRTKQKGHYNSIRKGHSIHKTKAEKNIRKVRKGHSIHKTKAEKNIRKVRKELAILIKKLQAEGIKDSITSAREYINFKYGKGWRERGLCVNDDNQWKPLNQY